MSNKTMRELLAELASARSQLAHADVARGVTEEANAKLRADLAASRAERDKWEELATQYHRACQINGQESAELAAKVVVMGEALEDARTALMLVAADNRDFRKETIMAVNAIQHLEATLPARAKLLGDVVEALDEYKHAMEGFAEAVRAESGHAYPWPAQDIALEKVASVLAAWRAKP